MSKSTLQPFSATISTGATNPANTGSSVEAFVESDTSTFAEWKMPEVPNRLWKQSGGIVKREKPLSSSELEELKTDIEKLEKERKTKTWEYEHYQWMLKNSGWRLVGSPEYEV